MQKQKRPNKRRAIGFLVGITLSVAVLAFLLMPQNIWMISAGPMNTGHEKLDCEECHRAAQGTLRQQLQANMQYLLANRDKSVHITRLPVSNDDCLACHRRPKDNHPVFRFFEPRFKEARQKIQPQYCNSCHKDTLVNVSRWIQQVVLFVTRNSR